MELGVAFWNSFGIEERLKALDFVESSSGGELWQAGNPEASIFYGKLVPRCLGCQTAIPLGSLREGHITCQCKRKIKIRQAGPFTRQVIPQARWIFHESMKEGDSQEVVLFACLSCGKGIEANGAERVIQCASCCKKSFLPDALWRYFYPLPEKSLFFVLCMFQYHPQLVLGAQHSNPEKRKSAAQQKLPEEIFAQLIEDPSLDVLLTLAENPELPTRLLEQLIKRNPPGLLEELVERTDTKAPVLAAISKYAFSFALQNAAKQHPNHVDALASREFTRITESKAHTEEELRRLAREALQEAQKQQARSEAPREGQRLRFRELPPDADPYRAAPIATTEVPPAPPQPTEEPKEPSSDTWRETFLRWIRSR